MPHSAATPVGACDRSQARRIVRQASQPGHALMHNLMRRGGGRSGLTLPRYGHALVHYSMHRGGGRSGLTLPRYEIPTLLSPSLASVVILFQAEEGQ